MIDAITPVPQFCPYPPIPISAFVFLKKILDFPFDFLVFIRSFYAFAMIIVGASGKSRKPKQCEYRVFLP